MARSDAPDAGPFEQYRSALARYFARRVRDPSEVDDLVQEAFARLLSASHRSGTPDNPEAWLFRVARNLLVDHYRTHGQATFQPLDADLDPGEPARQEEGRMLSDVQYLLEAALEELSDNCRAVFIMRRFEDLDTAAIAKRMGISRRMVQKYLVQAVTHLYQRLASVTEDRT